MIQFDHDQLSVFGIGEELAEGEWRGVVRQLLAQGLLAVEGEYGTLVLTEASGRCCGASGRCRCARSRRSRPTARSPSARPGRAEGEGRRGRAARGAAAGCSRRCGPGAAEQAVSRASRRTSSSTTPRCGRSPRVPARLGGGAGRDQRGGREEARDVRGGRAGGAGRAGRWRRCPERAGPGSRPAAAGLYGARAEPTRCGPDDWPSDGRWSPGRRTGCTDRGSWRRGMGGEGWR